MAYQEQNGDYRVKAEQADTVPTYFYYHFWHYQDGEWKYLYKAPEVVMVENSTWAQQPLFSGRLRLLAAKLTHILARKGLLHE